MTTTTPAFEDGDETRYEQQRQRYAKLTTGLCTVCAEDVALPDSDLCAYCAEELKDKADDDR